MEPKPFDAEVRVVDGVAVMDLTGDINSSAEHRLNEAYEEAVRQDQSGIVLNFTSVDYINSSGIALIVGLLARSRQLDQRLHSFGLSPHYLEVFQITRLVDFMTVCEDEESALSGASATS